MLGKELFDLLTIVLQLRLQHPQLSDASHCQTTFGQGKSVRRTKFGRLAKELQTPLVGFGSR